MSARRKRRASRLRKGAQADVGAPGVGAVVGFKVMSHKHDMDSAAWPPPVATSLRMIVRRLQVRLRPRSLGTRRWVVSFAGGAILNIPQGGRYREPCRRVGR